MNVDDRSDAIEEPGRSCASDASNRRRGPFARRRPDVLAVCILALTLAGATSAEEAPEEEDLRRIVDRLEARIEVLESNSAQQKDALREANDQIEDQRAELDRARDDLAAAETRLGDQSARLRELSNGQTEASSLARFLAGVEFNGAIALSYNWNFNNPDSQPALGFPNTFGPGDNGPAYPQVKHNTFQLDQARLATSRTSTEEERAGFALEFLYGVSANPTDGSDDPIIQQAYVSYLVPLAGGVEVRIGRWDTPLGAEVIYVGENFNITRGLLWVLQPFNHDGIIATGPLGNGFHWKAGVANNGDAVNFDNNNAKTALVQLGWSGERQQVRLTYMAEDGPPGGPFASPSTTGNSDIRHFVDLAAFWDPNERLSFWLNADWIHTDFRNQDESDLFALALAGRAAITDDTGASLRAEWAGRRPGDQLGKSVDAVWLTTTFDHAVTSNLSLRAELAYFLAMQSGGPDNFFVNGAGTARTKRSQLLAIAQAIYFF